MKILLTLDYELFLGRNIGTAQKCLIEPTNKLLALLDDFGVKATFFVDAGYLFHSLDMPSLHDDRSMVILQLQVILAAGHDIQLHIHPHWEDAKEGDGEILLPSTRYRLQQFDTETIAKIVEKYKTILVKEFNIHPIAYRAGGWCIQPFDILSNILYEQGIKMDSSVFPGGYLQSPGQKFDFRNAPIMDYWHFDDDPLVAQNRGHFIELPIASMKVSPLFYWRMVVAKLINKQTHRSFGDGKAVESPLSNILKLLSIPSMSVISIDGYKSKLLMKAYDTWKQKHKHMVIMGHPKAFSECSLSQLKLFLQETITTNQFITFRDWYHEHHS